MLLHNRREDVDRQAVARSREVGHRKGASLNAG